MIVFLRLCWYNLGNKVYEIFGGIYMKLRRAKFEEYSIIYELVSKTIEDVYPKYYPLGVVNFFLKYHSEERIKCAFEEESVLVGLEDDKIVATGSLYNNEIKRMFVHKDYQGRGIGKKLIEELEKVALSQGFNKVILDSSLSGYGLYSNSGYVNISYNKLETETGEILCYNTMEKLLYNNKEYKINYNNKTFAAVSNTDNGEVSKKTLFKYRQEENIVWAEYLGGEIKKGFLIGVTDREGKLNFNYAHVNEEGELRSGYCTSLPEIMDNGKVRLFEKWQWTSGDRSQGESIIEEI